MSLCKAFIVAVLCAAFASSAFGQEVTAISLFPQGTCDGPDGNPKKCGDGLPPCGCEGFQCAGCPGCKGEPFRGSCLSKNIAILCAQPICDECKIGQDCDSDADCQGCGFGVKCKACTICGKKQKGTCRKESEPIACPAIGCVDCEKRTCSKNSDCSLCGVGYECKKCPTCDGKTPPTGTCQKTRFGLCPVLDCKCDKRGNQCSNNSDCCPDSEICSKCPPCPRSNFFPKFGQCISKSFRAIPHTASSSLSTGGLGLPICPPCLPDYPFPGPILP